MLYIKDMYGNKLENVINPTFFLSGMPFQRKYSSAEIPGVDGEIETSEPVVSSANRTISGTLYGSTKDEVQDMRNKLADIVGRGKIKAGYENETWYVVGQVTSFDHKYVQKSDRHIAEVRISIQCDEPYIFADEVTEEWIVPSDYPTRIEMKNPHPSANVKFGRFDVNTGAKTSDQNAWELNSDYILSRTIGEGFEFDCVGGFTLSVWHTTTVRRLKIFIDGVFSEEKSYAHTTPDYYFIPVKLNDQKQHTITIVNSDVCTINYIDLIPSNLQTLINAGSVSDYPEMEIESVDTEATFSPLGKVKGDTNHPITIRRSAATDINSITKDSGQELGDSDSWDKYSKVFFKNTEGIECSTLTLNNFVYYILEYNLKALQSAYASFTATEIQANIQSILNELWAYAEGAIEVGDPSFESGVNGFGPGAGVTVTQSTKWKQTGNNSLKMATDGSQQWSAISKTYGDQHGKTIKAKVTFYDPAGGNVVMLQWYDVTNSKSLKTVEYTMSALEIKNLELEMLIPNDCLDVRLYIYPSRGVLEARTVYVDDVTVIANGVEVYAWTGSSWGLRSSKEDNFPVKLTSNLTNSYIQSEGKLYILVKSKYPSDGISASKVYLDHARLSTVMNFAKLSSEAIVNYGGNLIPAFTSGEWTIHANAKVLNDYELELKATSDWQGTHLTLDVVSGATYTLTLDVEGDLNGRIHYTPIVDGVNQPNISLFDAPNGKISTSFSVASNIDKISLSFSNDYGAGRIVFKNPILTQTSEIQSFRSQEKQIIEFSSNMALTKSDNLNIDTKPREIEKNGASQYSLMNSDFKFNPLQIQNGLNHFILAHTGANMKVTMKYRPKWR